MNFPFEFPDASHKLAASPEGTPLLAFTYRLLLWCYFPFLLAVCAGLCGGVALLIINWVWLPLAFVLIGLCVVTVAQVLVAFAVRDLEPPDTGIEVRVPRKHAARLYELVADIADERDLRAPDEIRVGADTVAHVYEDERDKKILVLGGMAVAAFSEDALAGIIAHELGHFTAGDTRLARRGYQRALVMAYLDWYFAGSAAAFLNPVLWFMRLYHFAYRVVWAAHSRQQEFAADRHEVALAGKKLAGASLIHVTVTERLPWVRLSSIAVSYVNNNQNIEKIFAEQVDRVQAVEGFEWEEALQKELKRPTAWFDSHPSLRQRLKAMGVSPRKALKLALDDTGRPATELFDDWPELERELTIRLVDMVRVYQEEKREAASICMGRPV